MKLHKAGSLRSVDDAFKVIGSTERSQIALMSLLPGQDSGEDTNEHPGSDQVLVVMEGRGHATVGGKSIELEEGDVLHIRGGEEHKIFADGAVALRTLNVYAPKAYPDQLEEEQEQLPKAGSFPRAT